MIHILEILIIRAPSSSGDGGGALTLTTHTPHPQPQAVEQLTANTTGLYNGRSMYSWRNLYFNSQAQLAGAGGEGGDAAGLAPQTIPWLSTGVGQVTV